MDPKYLFSLDLKISDDMPRRIIDLARQLKAEIELQDAEFAPSDLELVTFEQLEDYLLNLEPDQGREGQIKAKNKASLCWSAMSAYEHAALYLPTYCLICRRRLTTWWSCPVHGNKDSAISKPAFMLLRFEDMPRAGKVSRQRLMDFIEHLKAQPPFVAMELPEQVSARAVRSLLIELTGEVDTDLHRRVRLHGDVESLKVMMQDLDERQVTLVILDFGLDGEARMTRAELEQHFGLNSQQLNELIATTHSLMRKGAAKLE
jgi:hypothetical protein